MPGNPTLSTPEAVGAAPHVTHFDEAWQAQVFAMTTLLNERGVFTWGEWAEIFGAELKAGPQEAGNAAYFAAWLAALEKILAATGITDAAAIADLADDWRAAAARTPHGAPIVLGHEHRG